MRKALTWIAVIGVATYFVWQVGRMHGKAEARAEMDDVSFFTCRATDDPEALECQSITVPGSEAGRVYDELINELQNPSNVYEEDAKYQAYRQRNGL